MNCIVFHRPRGLIAYTRSYSEKVRPLQTSVVPRDYTVPPIFFVSRHACFAALTFSDKKHSRMRCYFSSLQYNRFMGVYGQFNKRCEVKQHRVSNLRRFSPVMGDKMKELPHELKKVNAVMPESECSLVSKTRGFKHCKALNFCISLSFELHTCSWIVVNDLKCDLPYP